MTARSRAVAAGLAPAALVAVAAAGCGQGTLTALPAGPAAFAPAGDDAPAAVGFLLAVDGPARLELAPGATAPARVVYRRVGGEPVPGAQVRFWLEGAPETARLVAGEATSDDAGLAQVELVAGDAPGAAYKIGANAEQADDVYIDVSVTGADDDGAGRPEVEWEDAPDVAGAYDVESHYDLTSRLGGGGEGVRQVAAALADPGAFVAGFIRVDGFVGGLVQGVAAGLITDLLAARAPPWLAGAASLGDDILSLVTDLRVRSELVVAKVRPEGAWEGTHTWKTIAYEVDRGCPPPPAGDGCGAADLPVPADAAAMPITGAVAQDGAVDIYEHALDVDVAPLAVRLALLVALPARTGQTSLGALLSDALDCDDFGAAGEQAVGIPFTAGAIAAGCRAGLEEAGEALEQQLADALTPELGNVTGRARAMDGDRDGRWEKWGAGVWTGVDGTFTAVRRP